MWELAIKLNSPKIFHYKLYHVNLKLDIFLEITDCSNIKLKAIKIIQKYKIRGFVKF